MSHRFPRARPAPVSCFGAAAVVVAAGACAVAPATVERALFEPVGVPDGVPMVTVEAGPRNTLWVGGPASLYAVAPDGTVRERIRLPPGDEAWRLAGWTDRALVVVAGSGRAAVLDRADGTLLWQRSATRPERRVVADPEWVYEILENSAVYGIEPATGEVRWAWARLGAPTAAAIIAPEGDRMYQLLGEGGDATLLLRDLGNGRIVGRAGVRGEPLALAAGARGGVFAASRLDRQLVVTRLRPVPDAVDVEWVGGIPTAGPIVRAYVAVSPMGDQVAVRTEGRIYVLDARTGEELGGFEGEYDDVGYDEGGRLYLVREGRLLRRRAEAALSGARPLPRGTPDTSADSGAR